MGDLSLHFNRAEFKCKCGKCDFDTVDAELITMLEDIRIYFGRPVIINSSCRCAKHNEAVGGGKSSQHLFGRAADIVVKGFTPSNVQSYVLNRWPNRYGIGVYDTFTHVDSRSTKARW